MRTYKSAAPGDGATLGTFIFEFEGDERGPEVLHMLASTMPETVHDTITALQRAYRTGREDRSEEILGDDGLARGIGELSRHIYDIPKHRCACGWLGAEGGWRGHLVYEVLQAAGATSARNRTAGPAVSGQHSHPIAERDEPTLRHHLISMHMYGPGEVENLTLPEMLRLHNEPDAHPHLKDLSR